MNDYKTLDKETQLNSRRDLLESTRLSSLPKRNRSLGNAPTSQQTVITTCGGGGGRIDSLDHIQEFIGACRKCICVYAKVEALFEQNEKRRRCELLEIFVAEVKR